MLSKVFEWVALDQRIRKSYKDLIWRSIRFYEKPLNRYMSFMNDKILKGFDDGLLTGMILIDPLKAFDSINHDIPLKKLSIVRFSDHTVKWFKFCLLKMI